MAGKRKSHSAAFKAQVALAALKGDKTVNEVAAQFGVHPTLIHDWKKKLLAGAEAVFASGAKATGPPEDKTVNELAGHHGVHPTLIHAWKKQLLAGAEGLFAGPAQLQAASADAEARQAELFEQIGRLKMELEWIKKKVAPYA